MIITLGLCGLAIAMIDSSGGAALVCGVIAVCHAVTLLREVR